MLPFLGSIVGIFVFTITFSIMESIESDMESKISNFIPKNKLYTNDIKLDEIESINNILIKNNINFFNFEEGKFLIKKNNTYKILNLILVDDLDHLIKLKYDLQTERFKDQNLKFVAGKTMTDNFSNHIEIISTTDINMITSTPKTYKLNLDGLIDFDFMNFDNNFAYIDREYAIHKNIKFKSNNKYLFIDDEINKNILSLIKNVNSDINIVHWKEEYTNLFNSIIVEKYLYSLFGLFIILISNFTFIIITSSTLLNKIKVLGILQVIGFNKYIINNLILSFSLFQNFLSLIIGILLSKIFFMINFQYDIIGKIFNNVFLIDTIFNLSFKNIILVSIFSFISIILASFFPIMMIKNVNIKDKLNYLN
tara:strand:+ start:899 stop:1999 length:1101 start_codon:yes stop_codon:yes gene_type:complete